MCSKIEKEVKSKRKWMPSEILQVLEFIHEEGNFEGPTARQFYTKCLEKTKIDSAWHLVRWKVRYLRTTFKKADDFRKSLGAKLLETQGKSSKVTEKIKKICPYYDQMKEIFGGMDENYEDIDAETRSSTTSPTIINDPLVSSDNSVDNQGAYDPVFIKLEEPDSSMEENATKVINQTTPTTSKPMEETPPTPVSNDLKENNEKLRLNAIEDKIKSQTSKTFDRLTMMQIEKNEIEKLKIELESRRLNREFKFTEKRLQLEEMKVLEEIGRRKEDNQLRQQELDIKKMALEVDERVRMFEIEKQERVERYEIQMRYQNLKANNV